LQEDIKNRAKVDLKHTKNISDEFCDLDHSGIVYSMNFVVNDDNCICHGITVESVDFTGFRALWISKKLFKH
jgi:hypothetical protein